MSERKRHRESKGHLCRPHHGAPELLACHKGLGYLHEVRGASCQLTGTYVCRKLEVWVVLVS